MKIYTHAFITLQLSDQNHMIEGLLKPARRYFQEKNVPVGGFELDPSLNRTDVLEAYLSLGKRYLDLQDRKRGEKGGKVLHISVAKGGDKSLDTLGRKSTKDFWVFDLDTIHSWVKWDLFANDLYVMGREVGVQATGVVIGGFMSAQHADICLMATESRVPWNSVFDDNLHIGRFRDNIICLCPLADITMHMPKVKKYLEDRYRLELDWEQAGRCLTFLEAQVWCEGPNLTSLKNKLLLS